MELSLATIYGLLLALGLVSVDTVLNANTLYLDSSVAAKFEEAGYTSEVVEQHLIHDLAIIADTKSLIKAPVVKSSDSPSFSAAIASVVNLQDSLEAAQQLVGFAPPKLYAAAVLHGETDTMELTGRSPVFGRFSIKVDGSDKLIDEMIAEAAYKTFRELDPYTAILYRFTQNVENLSAVEAEVNEMLDRLKTTTHQDSVAELHNLKGIILLDRNDIEGALGQFQRALNDDPNFFVARLNVALAMIQLNRFHDALKSTDFVTYMWPWSPTSDPIIQSASYVLRGIAHSRQNRVDEALADFQMAAHLQPTSTAAFWYWGVLLEQLGDTEGAAEKFAAAKEKLVYFETYPEIALLYFWVSAQDKRPLERRHQLPSWGHRDSATTAPAPVPAPTPATPSESKT